MDFKVNLASPGRFHMFDLAQQLSRFDVLKKLYTGYPHWKIGQISRQKILTFPWLMTPYMVSARMGWQNIRKGLEKSTVISFDRWLKKTITQAEIFHCLSGFGLETHEYLKNEFGTITFCDRGSCHIAFQKKILEQEYAKFHQNFYFDPWAVAREIDEYNLCDFIVIPSSFALRSFLNYGIDERKLIKVPYGVDLSLFRPGVKRDKIFRVIYVGSISIEKGIPYLLEAVGKIRLPNFEVWLIGGITPEIRPTLEQYSDNFSYKGYIPRGKLAEYYSQGSILVMPSLQEGLSLVQAQAMACGLPVVATENSGAEDLFTHGIEGLIIKGGHTSEINAAILQLYENPQLRDQMAISALKRVRVLGGWKEYGVTMLKNYENIISTYPIIRNQP